MTKLVVTLGFLVAFIAGLAVGMSVRQRRFVASAGPATRPSSHASWMIRELDLTPQQAAQMRQIWSQLVHHGGPAHEEHRGQIRQERKKAIEALIPAQKMSQYQQIQDNYVAEMAALHRESQASYQDAVEKTKAILTPEQRKKYDDFLSRHQTGRDHESEKPRGNTHATSRPASQPWSRYQSAH
jgi:Spy/CpxP family protein refolding chaperone